MQPSNYRGRIRVKREGKGFLKLLRIILSNEVSRVIAHPDRLVRFGLEIMEETCKAHNCEIVVLNQETKSKN